MMMMLMTMVMTMECKNNHDSWMMLMGSGLFLRRLFTK